MSKVTYRFVSDVSTNDPKNDLLIAEIFVDEVLVAEVYKKVDYIINFAQIDNRLVETNLDDIIDLLQYIKEELKNS